MNALEGLYEQVPYTSRERWGRGPTEDEIAMRAAAILTEKCGKCGWTATGPFSETHALYVKHAKAGCR